MIYCKNENLIAFSERYLEKVVQLSRPVFERVYQSVFMTHMTTLFSCDYAPHCRLRFGTHDGLFFQAHSESFGAL